MANIPLPDELVGNSVTEGQFKQKMTQLLESIESADQTQAKINQEINLERGQRIKDSTKILMLDFHGFSDYVFVQHDEDFNITFAVKSNGDFVTNNDAGGGDSELLVDFYSEFGQAAFLITDNGFNIVFGNESGGRSSNTELIRDFYSTQSHTTFLITDSGFNVVYGSESASSGSGTDLSNIPNSYIQPIPLKDKQAYNDYGTVKLTVNTESDLYNVDINTLIPNGSGLAAVYALYDDLVTRFSTRMTMSIIGYDGQNSEIRQYTYTPRLLITGETSGGDTSWETEDIAPMKVVVLTGVHGGEKDAILNLYITIKEMLERAETNADLLELSQTQLVIIPAAAPSTVQNGTRNNWRGINVNRNCRSGFVAGGDSGAEPLDQEEAALAVSLPQMHPDAVCFIDHHNYSSGSMAAWLSTHSMERLKVLKRVAFRLNQTIPKNYQHIASRPIRMGKNAGGTVARDWQLESGVNGYLIESSLTHYNTGVSYPFWQNRQLGIEIIRTALSEIIKHYRGI